VMCSQPRWRDTQGNCWVELWEPWNLMTNQVNIESVKKGRRGFRHFPVSVAKETRTSKWVERVPRTDRLESTDVLTFLLLYLSRFTIFYSAYVYCYNSVGVELNHWRRIWASILPSGRYSDNRHTEQVSEECSVFSNSQCYVWAINT